MTDSGADESGTRSYQVKSPSVEKTRSHPQETPKVTPWWGWTGPYVP